MSLYRVLFRDPGGLTELRTCHGAEGHCGLREHRRDTCPEVEGLVTEAWIPARSAVEAASVALMRYPGAGIAEVLRGLSPKQRNAADACAAVSRLAANDRQTVMQLIRTVDRAGSRMERFA